MGKPIDVSHVKAVGFTAIKFTPTEARPEGGFGVELNFYNANGARCGSANMPSSHAVIKTAVKEGGFNEAKQHGLTYRAESKHLYAVRNLQVQEGDQNKTAMIVAGDYDIVGISPISRLVVADSVGVGDLF